jgi:signal transduction histidine kinase
MSAKLFMGAAQKNPVETADLLQKAIDYQGMALEEIRRLSKFLNNSLIKTVGLKGSIGDVLYNLKTVANLDAELDYDKEIDRRLSDDQQLMLFRIIQEQTSNIIKYAEAKNVSVLLKSSDTNFSLVITDDGIGFDPDKKRNGIGLMNIKNRTSAYNGEMHLQSSPGKGCRLEVIFPF